jgi:hypothetical protein
MSFQETLVSKKQKQTKKILKMYKKKTKFAKKKTKIADFSIFNSYHNNKTRLKFITRIFSSEKL